MSGAVPAIYSPRFHTEPVRWWWRATAVGVMVGCLAVLVIAARLTPSPAGIGTHEQLGQQPCGFLARTGLPCGSCGMTTSFAWFVRGNLAASFYVQPMGCVLALLCGMAVWVAGYIALTGRPVLRLMNLVRPRSYLLPLVGLFVIAWGWKILLHLTGHDGW